MLDLEKGSEGVISEDGWHDQIDQEITSELRKYRTYRTNSIRDLLRAFRNKVSNIIIFYNNLQINYVIPVAPRVLV